MAPGSSRRRWDERGIGELRLQIGDDGGGIGNRGVRPSRETRHLAKGTALHELRLGAGERDGLDFSYLDPLFRHIGKGLGRTKSRAYGDVCIGRVEKRRGGGRRGELLLPAAFARCRCLSPRHCSVSSSRSSNATCGFPALRSPTGFTWGPRRAHVIGASVRDG